ncbi:MAG: class I SAM-dependent methyltransferase [Proteobacteria bacterium]|nr:class I SAM-dependent methyltransferase [Pseudomonadota bacterium]
MSQKTFKELEHDGWTERAQSYDFITPVTNQAINPILSGFAAIKGQRLLEVACGPGHLSGEAARRGAVVEAVDFALPMVELAAARYADVSFHEGDAENLDYADNLFDGVVCAFGLLHLQHPQRAIAQAYRVLKAGGRYTYTVWCPPDQGGEFFGFLMSAIQAHGDLNVDLPEGPPFYRFADPHEASSALALVGFAQPSFTTIPIVWRGQEPRDAVDVIYKATVRTKAILDAQSDDARNAIHDAIISGVEQFRRNDGFEIALPALMVSAEKL